MKKTVLLLAVCLMLGLCACGLREQSVARNTVEPVHFSAPAVRQDAAPAEEPRVTLPQGASLLTEQELRWFGGSCFNVLPSRGPNLFLAASYDRAEDMDLASLFAAGAGSRELSDRELRQLGMDGCARPDGGGAGGPAAALHRAWPGGYVRQRLQWPGIPGGFRRVLCTVR